MFKINKMKDHMYTYSEGEEHEQGVYHTVALPLHILKDVVVVKLFPSIHSFCHPSSPNESIM
jgi:hypothetical protein